MKTYDVRFGLEGEGEIEVKARNRKDAIAKARKLFGEQDLEEFITDLGVINQSEIVREDKPGADWE